jgi:oligosaccharyl transferase (archaeosortase A-associated)
MKKKIPVNLLITVLLIIFFAISLIFRVVYPYDDVFTSEGIKFTSNDAYFHMRTVDSLVHNFPRATEFDPYLIYPNKYGGLAPSFMDWFLALIIIIVGLGSPTAHTIDVIGVYFPAILAALTVIPVFFIGKVLFNRWVGVFAAALTAILPGEFLGRSILGFTDNHIAETLLSTVAVLFIILALKAASEKQLSLSHFTGKNRGNTVNPAVKESSEKQLAPPPITGGNRGNIIKPIVFSILAGLFLGLYLITWQGGLMFVFIITLYFIIQFIVNHFKQKSSEYLGITGFLIFLVAVIIFLPAAPTLDFYAAGIIALLLPPVLMVISMMMFRFKTHPVFYPLVLVVIGGAFIGIFYAINQEIIQLMVDKFVLVFNPGGATATTTLEMQPFLYPQLGVFSTGVAWGNFTTSFFLAPKWPIPGFAFISLIILIVLYFRKKGNDNLLLFFFIWTLIIVIATLAQRRFAYYLVINIAILSAYISWQAIWYAGLRNLLDKQGKPNDKAVVAVKDKKKKAPVKKQGLSVYAIYALLATIVVFSAVFLPNLIKSKAVAGQALFAPSDAWQSSLVWMRDNTPEPLGDPDAYYSIYKTPTASKPFIYPESAYGVTAWWDYGYWITRIARRIPSDNPSQASGPIKKVAGFFTESDESSAREMLKELGSSYLVLDYEISTNKFWAIATWAEKPEEKFYGIYFMPTQGNLVPVQALKPAFYQTMLARLYCFDGKAVTNIHPVVLSYEDRTDRSGHPYKLITNIKEFTDYQEALDYVASQTSGKHDIVGVSPFESPIPLEALEDFSLVHTSPETKPTTDNGTIPEIKIFEYSPE